MHAEDTSCWRRAGRNSRADDVLLAAQVTMTARTQLPEGRDAKRLAALLADQVSFLPELPDATSHAY